MKTMFVLSAVALTLMGLAATVAPTASATVCAVEDGSGTGVACVCVVNMPPGQGCGSRGTGCFVGVAVKSTDPQIGIGCV